MYRSEEEIKRKASNIIDKPINVLEVFSKQTSKDIDEEALVIKAYDYNNNVIANINVTAENGTNLRIGERFS